MTTQERIDRIIKETRLDDPRDKEVLKLELEALVIQAQLEAVKKII